MKNGSTERVNSIAEEIDSNGGHSLSLIKKLYNLPVITHTEKVDLDFYQYVKQRHYFLVIAAFDLQGRMLIIRDFSKKFGWELLGGSIGSEPIHDLNQSAQKISQKILGVGLYDIQPICFLNNDFQYKEETITHVGIALVARVNGSVSANSGIEWGFFKSIPSTMFTANNEIAKLATRVMSKKQYRPAVEEVTSSEAVSWRHLLHKAIVQRLIGKRASNQLKRAILGALPQNIGSLLDTSCGDDDFIITIAQKMKPGLIVCNDISVRHLEYLKQNADRAGLSSKLLFTNHDLLDLPFNYRFDVVLSKNTLHHLKTDEDVLTAIKEFRKLGKRVVIMDIDDPTNSSWVAWLWNKYYVHFLDDQGSGFLTHSRLRKILKLCCADNEFSIVKIKTIKGDYLLACIEPSSNI